MASTRVASPFYKLTFDTTAEMVAYSFEGGDIGSASVFDRETGRYYTVISTGAGMSKLAAVTDSLIEVPIPLTSFREVTTGGDVGNVAAIGGVLASDTTPILLGDAAEAMEITWATGNVDDIATVFTSPLRLDITRACYIDLWVASGSTDAATFVVETSDNGSAKVTDSASDSSTKSATIHKITATIAAGDIAAGAAVTLNLTPPTHATNAILLYGCSFRGYLA